MMPPITPGKARLYQVTRPLLRLDYPRQGKVIPSNPLLHDAPYYPSITPSIISYPTVLSTTGQAPSLYAYGTYLRLLLRLLLRVRFFFLRDLRLLDFLRDLRLLFLRPPLNNNPEFSFNSTLNCVL